MTIRYGRQGGKFLGVRNTTNLSLNLVLCFIIVLCSTVRATSFNELDYDRGVDTLRLAKGIEEGYLNTFATDGQIRFSISYIKLCEPNADDLPNIKQIRVSKASADDYTVDSITVYGTATGIMSDVNGKSWETQEGFQMAYPIGGIIRGTVVYNKNGTMMTENLIFGMENVFLVKSIGTSGSGSEITLTITDNGLPSTIRLTIKVAKVDFECAVATSGAGGSTPNLKFFRCTIPKGSKPIWKSCKKPIIIKGEHVSIKTFRDTDIVWPYVDSITPILPHFSNNTYISDSTSFEVNFSLGPQTPIKFGDIILERIPSGNVTVSLNSTSDKYPTTEVKTIGFDWTPGTLTNINVGKIYLQGEVPSLKTQFSVIYDGSYYLTCPKNKAGCISVQLPADMGENGQILIPGPDFKYCFEGVEEEESFGEIEVLGQKLDSTYDIVSVNLEGECGPNCILCQKATNINNLLSAGSFHTIEYYLVGKISTPLEVTSNKIISQIAVVKDVSVKHTIKKMNHNEIKGFVLEDVIFSVKFIPEHTPVVKKVGGMEGCVDCQCSRSNLGRTDPLKTCVGVKNFAGCLKEQSVDITPISSISFEPSNDGVVSFDVMLNSESRGNWSGYRNSTVKMSPDGVGKSCKSEEQNGIIKVTCSNSDFPKDWEGYMSFTDGVTEIVYEDAEQVNSTDSKHILPMINGVEINKCSPSASGNIYITTTAYVQIRFDLSHKTRVIPPVIKYKATTTNLGVTITADKEFTVSLEQGQDLITSGNSYAVTTPLTYNQIVGNSGGSEKVKIDIIDWYPHDPQLGISFNIVADDSSSFCNSKLFRYGQPACVFICPYGKERGVLSVININASQRIDIELGSSELNYREIIIMEDEENQWHDEVGLLVAGNNVDEERLKGFEIKFDETTTFYPLIALEGETQPETMKVNGKTGWFLPINSDVPDIVVNTVHTLTVFIKYKSGLTSEGMTINVLFTKQPEVNYKKLEINRMKTHETLRLMYELGKDTKVFGKIRKATCGAGVGITITPGNGSNAMEEEESCGKSVGDDDFDANIKVLIEYPGFVGVQYAIVSNATEHDDMVYYSGSDTRNMLFLRSKNPFLVNDVTIQFGTGSATKCKPLEEEEECVECTGLDIPVGWDGRVVFFDGTTKITEMLDEEVAEEFALEIAKVKINGEDDDDDVFYLNSDSELEFVFMAKEEFQFHEYPKQISFECYKCLSVFTKNCTDAIEALSNIPITITDGNLVSTNSVAIRNLIKDVKKPEPVMYEISPNDLYEQVISNISFYLHVSDKIVTCEKKFPPNGAKCFSDNVLKEGEEEESCVFLRSSSVGSGSSRIEPNTICQTYSQLIPNSADPVDFVLYSDGLALTYREIKGCEILTPNGTRKIGEIEREGGNWRCVYKEIGTTLLKGVFHTYRMIIQPKSMVSPKTIDFKIMQAPSLGFSFRIAFIEIDESGNGNIWGKVSDSLLEDEPKSYPPLIYNTGCTSENPIVFEKYNGDVLVNSFFTIGTIDCAEVCFQYSFLGLRGEISGTAKNLTEVKSFTIGSMLANDGKIKMLITYTCTDGYVGCQIGESGLIYFGVSGDTFSPPFNVPKRATQCSNTNNTMMCESISLTSDWNGNIIIFTKYTTIMRKNLKEQMEQFIPRILSVTIAGTTSAMEGNITPENVFIYGNSEVDFTLNLAKNTGMFVEDIQVEVGCPDENTILETKKVAVLLASDGRSTATGSVSWQTLLDVCREAGKDISKGVFVGFPNTTFYETGKSSKFILKQDTTPPKLEPISPNTGFVVQSCSGTVSNCNVYGEPRTAFDRHSNICFQLGPMSYGGSEHKVLLFKIEEVANPSADRNKLWFEAENTHNIILEHTQCNNSGGIVTQQFSFEANQSTLSLVSGYVYKLHVKVRTESGTESEEVTSVFTIVPDVKFTHWIPTIDRTIENETKLEIIPNKPVISDITPDNLARLVAVIKEVKCPLNENMANHVSSPSGEIYSLKCESTDVMINYTFEDFEGDFEVKSSPTNKILDFNLPQKTDTSLKLVLGCGVGLTNCGLGSFKVSINKSNTEYTECKLSAETQNQVVCSITSVPLSWNGYISLTNGTETIKKIFSLKMFNKMIPPISGVTVNGYDSSINVVFLSPSKYFDICITLESASELISYEVGCLIKSDMCDFEIPDTQGKVLVFLLEGTKSKFCLTVNSLNSLFDPSLIQGDAMHIMFLYGIQTSSDGEPQPSYNTKTPVVVNAKQVVMSISEADQDCNKSGRGCITLRDLEEISTPPYSAISKLVFGPKDNLTITAGPYRVQKMPISHIFVTYEDENGGKTNEDKSYTCKDCYRISCDQEEGCKCSLPNIPSDYSFETCSFSTLSAPMLYIIRMEQFLADGRELNVQLVNVFKHNFTKFPYSPRYLDFREDTYEIAIDFLFTKDNRYDVTSVEFENGAIIPKPHSLTEFSGPVSSLPDFENEISFELSFNIKGISNCTTPETSSEKCSTESIPGANIMGVFDAKPVLINKEGYDYMYVQPSYVNEEEEVSLEISVKLGGLAEFGICSDSGTDGFLCDNSRPIEGWKNDITILIKYVDEEPQLGYFPTFPFTIHKDLGFKSCSIFPFVELMSINGNTTTVTVAEETQFVTVDMFLTRDAKPIPKTVRFCFTKSSFACMYGESPLRIAEDGNKRHVQADLDLTNAFEEDENVTTVRINNFEPIDCCVAKHFPIEITRASVTCGGSQCFFLWDEGLEKLGKINIKDFTPDNGLNNRQGVVFALYIGVKNAVATVSITTNKPGGICKCKLADNFVYDAVRHLFYGVFDTEKQNCYGLVSFEDSETTVVASIELVTGTKTSFSFMVKRYSSPPKLKDAAGYGFVSDGKIEGKRLYSKEPSFTISLYNTFDFVDEYLIEVRSLYIYLNRTIVEQHSFTTSLGPTIFTQEKEILLGSDFPDGEYEVRVVAFNRNFSPSQDAFNCTIDDMHFYLAKDGIDNSALSLCIVSEATSDSEELTALYPQNLFVLKVSNLISAVGMAWVRSANISMTVNGTELNMLRPLNFADTTTDNWYDKFFVEFINENNGGTPGGELNIRANLTNNLGEQIEKSVKKTFKEPSCQFLLNHGADKNGVYHITNDRQFEIKAIPLSAGIKVSSVSCDIYKGWTKVKSRDIAVNNQDLYETMEHVADGSFSIDTSDLDAGEEYLVVLTARLEDRTTYLSYMNIVSHSVTCQEVIKSDNWAFINGSCNACPGAKANEQHNECVPMPKTEDKPTKKLVIVASVLCSLVVIVTPTVIVLWLKHRRNKGRKPKQSKNEQKLRASLDISYNCQPTMIGGMNPNEVNKFITSDVLNENIETTKRFVKDWGFSVPESVENAARDNECSNWCSTNLATPTYLQNCQNQAPSLSPSSIEILSSSNGAYLPNDTNGTSNYPNIEMFNSESQYDLF